MSSSYSEESIAKRFFQGEIANSPLVNKLGLTNQNEIDLTEAYYVEFAKQKGLSDKSKELSLTGLKSMHKEFFGEIYEWAGQFRPYQTGRGLPFCTPERIEKELGKYYQELNNSLFDKSKNIELDTFVKSTAKFMGDLNAVHPFIDGNGRTQRETLEIIAERAGFNLSLENLNKNEWYQAAESAMYGDNRGFEQIIKESVMLVNEKTLIGNTYTGRILAIEQDFVIQQRDKNKPIIIHKTKNLPDVNADDVGKKLQIFYGTDGKGEVLKRYDNSLDKELKLDKDFGKG